MNIPNQYKDYEVGVVVGRFQVHELHPGHIKLLDWVNDNYPQMVVALGSPAIMSSTRNPLPFRVREHMIRERYPHAIVVNVKDCPTDEEWSTSIDREISKDLMPHQRLVLFGSRDSFIPHYKGKYPTQELVGDGEDFWTGTEVRRQLVNKIGNSADFRAGVVYATSADYTRVIPTVDFAVFKLEPHDPHYGGTVNTGKVYVVRKQNQKEFRFPGGFVEPYDSIERNVYREASEELGSGPHENGVGNIQYIGSARIDDWRYRQERNKIMTSMFVLTTHADFTRPRDTNEIAEIRLVDLETLRDENGRGVAFAEEHQELLTMLREWYRENEDYGNHVATEAQRKETDDLEQERLMDKVNR